MQFTDSVTVAGTRRTADGYLVAEAKCVRTGIQLYTGAEVGMADKAVARIYRPPEEVFAQGSLQSFSHAPVTIDHPTEMVDAGNWRTLSVGEVSTAAKKDGEWVMLPLILKDASAIDAVTSGKRQLSAGYVCKLDMTPGVTPEGEAYDGRQTDIKINHLALVDRARAGFEARIGDGAAQWGVSPVTTQTADERTPDMPENLRKVLVDGLPVETTDNGAHAIEKLIKDRDALQGKLADAEKAHADAIKAKDEEIAKKDAALDAEKAKVLSDADLDKRVQARAALVTVAKDIAKDVKTDGLSDAAIRKAVVAANLGDAAVKDKSDAYVDARFDILVEDAAKNGGDDPFRTVVANGLQATNDSDKAVTDAYAKMISDMQSAHRPAAAN